jgi:serine/threonine protein kinase/predicted ATPase/Tfp pilus assembly protein PilF
VAGSERKTNLAAPSTRFVGREDDLLDLHEHLRHARLVTVLGPPGAGKTRLAVEYGLRHGGSFLAGGAGGVWFCDLAEATDLDGVFRAVAGALGVSLGEERTQDDASARLVNALISRGATLLVLDNFEQLVPVAVPTVEDWLRRAPELSVLVTSRVRLGVSGEVVAELGGLVLPSVETGFESDAVRLFLDRARLSRADFTPSPDERAIIAELVSRLDGLPLAIELAGARMGVLGPQQLLDRLSKNLDLLRGGKGRSATLRATLDWSWNLLPPEEQRALAQASVFHGGFSLEAAEAVLALDTDRELLDVLEGLRNSSLLRSYTVSELPGELRFGLLDTIRSYGQSRLAEIDPAHDTEARHARYFVEAGTRWASQVERSQGPSFLRRLVIELPNLMSVHRRALEGDSPSAAALSDALSVTLALEHVFYMRGPTAPCLAMLDRVFEHVLDGVDPKTVALSLKARGRALRDLGYLEEAHEALDRGLEIARRIGDRATEGRLLSHKAVTWQVAGRLEEALAAHQTATRIATGAGDRRTEGMLMGGLAAGLIALGRLDEAAETLDRALAIDQEVGNRYAIAAVLAMRAELNRARERPEAARADFEAAIEGYREFGEHRHEGIALTDLGILHQEQGRFEEARACLERAQQHHRELGSRAFQVTALATLGALEREQGRLVEARRLYEKALRIARDLGDRTARGRLLASLGGTYAALGRTDAAREALNDAERIASTAGDKSLSQIVSVEHAHLELALSDAAARQGERESALEHERAARALLDQALAAGPLPVRPAPERSAIRLLSRALAEGPPPPSRELTPSAAKSHGDLGRYELLLELAAGGMATVYVGRQRGAGGFERLVAIKRMHRHLTSLPEFTSAFLNEARIASMIRHPNVVSVHDVHEARGEHLLVMEYVDGTSLARLMQLANEHERTFPRDAAVYIVAQALRGLHAAHELTDIDGTPLGVVHRDATPHNILVGSDGSVRITDFGIAKVRQQAAHTRDGTAKGKVRYMAPEQARGEDLDRRADVFALGVVAWELLTGKRLLEGDSDLSILAELRSARFDPPSRESPSIDADLDALVMKALAPNRDARFSTALAFAQALEHWSAARQLFAREPEVSALVDELCGAELAQRRQSISEALANTRSADPARSLPPASPSTGAATADIGGNKCRRVMVAASGRWFEVPGAARVSLQRRRALRLILQALLDRRIDAPNVALTQPELLEAGWPGEKVKHEAGTLRVYNAVSTLRKLGLRQVLLSRDDGYLLDPGVDFERAGDVERS